MKLRQIKYFRTTGTWLFLLLFIGMVFAQGAPDQINAALADLSTRVGRTLTLNDLDNWLWGQELYNDASLGCPQAGQTYAQVQTVGYRFELTYANIVYDYRVSGDNTIIILCSQTPFGDVTNQPAQDDYNNPLCPPPAETEPNYMRSRLTAGTQGRVVSGGVNRLRADASKNAAEISQIPGEAIFTIDGGPRCAEGILWWNVNYDGLIGWTAEGEAGDYFVEPMPPRNLPVRVPITTENTLDVTELGRLQGNIQANIQWSPDGRFLAALGALGSDSVWLYQTDTLATTPRIVQDDEQMLSMVFRPDSKDVLVGTLAGTVHLLDLTPDSKLVERLFLQTHQSEVTTVAFHPDNIRFASAGRNALTNASVDKSFAILLWDTTTVAQTAVFAGHTDIVTDMAFNTDGTRLVSVSADRTMIIWDVATGQQVTRLDVQNSLRLNSVTISPNNQFIAIGTGDGRVVLLEAATGNTITTYNYGGLAVNSVAFSPDNTLIAAGGEDGFVRLWSTLSDTALASLQASNNPIFDVAFSPDGTILAAASRNHFIYLWGVQQTAG